MNSKEYQQLLEKHLGELIDVVSVHDEIDSSNSEAMRLINSGDLSSRLIIARSQTAGKGRRGRQWISPHDSGIYMSLVRVLQGGPESIAGLSLVTALTVWQTLADLNAEDIELKWPNDVLRRGSKLAGILLESRQLPARTAVVFGIGINLSFSAQEQARVDRELANLSSLVAAPIARIELICSLVRALWLSVDRYLEYGFEPFQQEWNSADGYIGQDVIIDNGVERLVGKHRGVDMDGVLLLETASGLQRISGGEVFPSLGLAQSQEELTE